ncbi:MAG: hypothetical protein IKG71_01105 [Firmicutes bacterium]|nr:hypothetical protein [Bacillota bacterium]
MSDKISSKTEKQKIDEIRNRKIRILVISLITCVAVAFGIVYFVGEQKKAREIAASREGVITEVAQGVADKFNRGIEWATFSLWDISDQEDLDMGAPLYRLSYSGSFSGEVDVYGQYDDGKVDIWSISIYINDPKNDAAAAANLYALGMNIFYNVERYGTEEEIREEMAYTTGWENSDMYFSSDDGYSVTINLGVMPDGEWDGQIWSGL